ILRDSTNTKDCRRTRTIKTLKRNQRLATLAQSESPFTSLKVPSSSTPSFVSRCRSESEIGILEAIQKADENRTLIGDFSEGHVLPLLKNPKVSDLKCISAQTVCDILENRYRSKINRIVLIDCRYPYEFNGGHIQTSINLYTQDLLREFLDNDTVIKQQTPASILENSTTPQALRNVILFYCEYSKERGPKMCRYLRTVDRKKNEYRYPCLDYPEIYLIEGGYKNFYGSFK
uniref:protein-tyrosine-phosphatase n=1 Tax=Romanomermis culicivorax TaxID=13658 RepID=A0A915JDT0_ROMCU